MVKINQNYNYEQKCHLYDKDNIFIGLLNETQFYDVRLQIAQQKLVGYYLIFLLDNDKEVRMDIDESGGVEPTEGCFDQIPKIISKIWSSK